MPGKKKASQQGGNRQKWIENVVRLGHQAFCFLNNPLGQRHVECLSPVGKWYRKWKYGQSRFTKNKHFRPWIYEREITRKQQPKR